MKRLLLLCLTYIMCVGNHQMAAQDSSESPGIFNSLAVVYLANLHTSFLCNLIYPTFSRILLYSC